MTDDDAEVFPDWITQIKRSHAEHPEAGAIGGKVIGANSRDNFVSRLSDVATFPLPDKPAYVRTVPGVNASYKRPVLEKVGPQDVSLPRGEDVDFNWRVKQAGYEVFFDPRIKVLHYHRPTLRKFFRQHYMYGRSYYLVRSKWHAMYTIFPHQLRTRRDFLKLGNFIASTLYQPLLVALKVRPRWNSLPAFPVLLINELLWKGAILQQMFLERRKRAKTPPPDVNLVKE
jgi:GT2 family glycosyltransferase